MKKRNGFTLIELLAVIVILAIIALISVPMVLKYIESSREKSFYNSIESIKKAAELKVMDNELSKEVKYPIVYNVQDLNLKNKTQFKGQVIAYKQKDGIIIILNNITDGTYTYSGTDSSSIIGDNNIWIVSPTFSDRILQYKPTEEGTGYIIDDYVSAPCNYYEYYEDYSSLYYTVTLEKGQDIDETMTKYDESMKEYLSFVPDYIKEERKILITKLKERFGSSITSSIDSEILHNFYNEIKDEIPFIYDVINFYFIDGTQVKYKFDLFRDTNNIVTVIPNQVNGQNIKRISKCSAGTGTSNDDFSQMVDCVSYSKIYNSYYDLIISNGIESIGDNYFQESYVLSVKLPNTLKEIGVNAFSGNYIQKLDLPTSLEKIGNSAFNSNEIEGKLVIPNSVTFIGNQAFAHNEITEVVISDSITTIGINAFNDNKIIEVIIPESVKTIRNGAFSNNEIKKITIKGDQTRFNESWTKIGFPAELMPSA